MNNNQDNVIYLSKGKLVAIVVIIFVFVFGFIAAVSSSESRSSNYSGSNSDSSLCVACHRNPRYNGQLCKSCYSEWLRTH